MSIPGCPGGSAPWKKTSVAINGVPTANDYWVALASCSLRTRTAYDAF